MTNMDEIRKAKSPLTALLILVLLIFSFGYLDKAPAKLVSDSAPQDVFSGARAKTLLDKFLQEKKPHPAGSLLNMVIRDRIVARLKELGLESEIQKDFKCSYRAPGCAHVENIIAVIKGTETSESAKAILLTSHYDSAPGAVGAADDMAGVTAMLEITANVLSAPTLKNDIILLFSDAEETGLRGAMSFSDSHPLMDRVGLVLNMEARGVTGPSVMFETGPGNLNQVSGFNEGTKNPVGSSLMVEIYKRMPNATDYTIYKMRELPGLNYGFSRGVSLYHSVLDDPDHLDVQSLQHHGDNLLAMVQIFGNKDLDVLPADQDATYIDLFGKYLISWPDSAGPWLALLAFIGLVVTVWRYRDASFKQGLWVVVVLIMTCVALPALGWLASFPLGQMGGLHPLDHPNPWPARAALISIALLGGCVGGMLSVRRAGSYMLFILVWLFFVMLGLLLAVTLPGASYIFIMPALAAGVTGAVMSFIAREKALKWASYAGLLIAAYMAVYHLLLLEAVINFQLSHFKMIVLLLLALPLLPVASLWQKEGGVGLKPVTVGIFVIALVSSGFATFVTAYTPDRPRSVNIVYHDDQNHNSPRWEIRSYGPVDHSYLFAAGFPDTPSPFLYYGAVPEKGYFIPADDLNLAGPVLSIDSDVIVDGHRILSGTVSSERDAFVLGIAFEEGSIVKTMHANGQLVLGSPKRAFSGPQLVRFHGAGKTPVSFVITLNSDDLSGVSVFDLGPIPNRELGRKLQQHRPATAAPFHFGDYSIVTRPFSSK